MKSPSDVALGGLLVVLGGAGVGDGLTVLGALLLAIGIALILRGALLVPPPAVRWRPRDLAIATAVVIALDVTAFSRQAAGPSLDAGDWLTRLLLQLGPPETAALLTFKLALLVSLARVSRLRAAGMVMAGVLLSMVGLDVVTGQLRLTFGIEPLMNGVDILVVIAGLVVGAESLACLVSPAMCFESWVRLVDGWRMPQLRAWAGVVLRVAAALVLAGAGVLAFYVNGQWWDVGMTLVLALVGIAAKRLQWNRLVLLVAMGVGVVLETSVRQTMLLSNGDPTIFLQRPFTPAVLAVAAAVLLAGAALSVRRRRREPNVTGH
jgi:TctA family transporter